MNTRRQLITYLAWGMLLAALIFVAWSWFSQGIVRTMVRSDLEAGVKVEAIKAFFDSFGNLAPLVYVLCVMMEVLIAPIPGLMLYAPGGVVFGGFQGGLLSLLGNTLGAVMGCAAVRGIGDAWLKKYFTEEKLSATQELLERRGFWFVFLLRVNPLTSSDLVSYAAGLTRIPLWQVMMATAFGMAPLCFAQAYLAENLLQRYPWLLYPLLVGLIVYVAVVIMVIFRMRQAPIPISDQKQRVTKLK